MSGLSFLKMHGLGNDFVVLDGRAAPIALTAAQVRAIADRHTGVGCDQLVIVGASRNGEADAFMRIFNADGGEIEACGNATRCVAAVAMAEKGTRAAVIETVAGLLAADAVGDGIVAVDMGPARLDWQQIPLAEARDTLRFAVEAGPLHEATAVNMGNPHAVFFVDDAEAVPMETWGPVVEHHPLFPERTNVEVVEVIAPDRIRMRVWERGTGVTRACGTGACASVVAAHRRGFTGRKVHVVLDGGTLFIEWRADGRVRMTGPVTTSFKGTLEPSLLGG
jgi:diaminopimelate epimerase